MSSPPPKEKLFKKLSTWLKPSKRAAGASGASPHPAPVSSSPSQSLTHAAGHALVTGSANTPEASGASPGTKSLAGVRPAHVASPQGVYPNPD
ncbi:hypothetical protein M413DRAFT_154837 [Hebeloma cylindrosporum]|uniref:Uncharacterized protein n=1 Tax=Hebeloma cylindrosporum TaxID=76867 RepID=A0A0C3BW64_HEBCY|nr:hypothetical protein M413DRAFT_154837 [Hebeloma cylindrosporum h7]